ncbi:unnamed protein product, partial [Ostreobium quekettii]
MGAHEKGGNPDLVRESQRRRFADVGVVDRVIELDRNWRNLQYQWEQLKKEFNALNKEIGKLRKAKEDTTDLQEKSKTMKKSIQDAEQEAAEAEKERDLALAYVGNLVHDSVPVSDDEENNAILKEIGQMRHEEGLKPHMELIQMCGIVNLEDAQKIAGSRAYYLINEGPLLNQALINYGMQFAMKRGFTPIQTPYFMVKDVMGECSQLSQFDEELYKVTGEGDDKYLIATSEQTLCALHRKKWFDKEDLPIKYVGYSTCFRKEAGSRSDTLGIFRVHQFEKVEQFIVCSPDDNESWRLMEEMLANSEDFFQSLGLPYRVVNIVSGELNNAAAKKYDLEAWFPGLGKFRELVSCSNCTDYQ